MCAKDILMTQLLLTSRQLAQILFYHPEYVRRLTREGRIRSHQIGVHHRYRLCEVLDDLGREIPFS